MFNLKRLKISEIGSSFGDAPFGSLLKSKDYVELGVPVIQGGNIQNQRFEWNNALYVTKEKFESLPRSHCQAGDLVFPKIGNRTVGSCAIVPSIEGYKTFLLSTNMMKMSVDPRKADLRFIYYYFCQEHIREKIISSAGGGAQPIFNFTSLKAFEVEIPDLPDQQMAVEFLRPYDELIEYNLRRIGILEAMARVLYQKCLQEDGVEISIKPILESNYWKFITANVSPYEGTKRYYATADIERLAIEGSGIDYTFSEKPSRAQKQPTPFSVWFARMKDTFKIAWYSDINAQSAEASIISSGFAGFQAAETAYFPLLFLTVSSQEFHTQKDLFCTGATQMSLTNEGLSRIQVPIPNETAARKLGEQVIPLLNQMLLLQLRIQNLRRTRDLLLPRLLSGQISLATN